MGWEVEHRERTGKEIYEAFQIFRNIESLVQITGFIGIPVQMLLFHSRYHIANSQNSLFGLN